MTGKQVAANLRGSTKLWGRTRLYEPATGAYCVLGLKAHEAGIPDHILVAMEASTNSYSHGTNVEKLYALNDRASTKESLIRTLESDTWRDFNFEVEEFVAKNKAIFMKGETTR